MSNGVVFLSGKKVNLRPPQRSDIPLFLRWVNDPEIRDFVLGTFPWTEKMEEEWFDKVGKDDKKVTLVIETKEGKPIGTMGIHDINWQSRTGTTGAMIGEKDYWGDGYGTDAKMVLLKYLFDTLGLRRIQSSVIAFNERSLRYSLHCGYKIEGRRREHIFKQGKFWDQVDLGVFRSEWLPIWKKYQRTGKVR
jgi:RimJ/RimL family protein N-acetyltransferase